MGGEMVDCVATATGIVVVVVTCDDCAAVVVDVAAVVVVMIEKLSSDHVCRLTYWFRNAQFLHANFPRSRSFILSRICCVPVVPKWSVGCRSLYSSPITAETTCPHVSFGLLRVVAHGCWGSNQKISFDREQREKSLFSSFSLVAATHSVLSSRLLHSNHNHLKHRSDIVYTITITITHENDVI